MTARELRPEFPYSVLAEASGVAVPSGSDLRSPTGCTDSDAAASRDYCIHKLFEEQAQRTPDSVALVYEDQQLTYAELNRQANLLAHTLRKQGVGPEVLVGLCVERSLQMVVGLLGILKAGGAYVPLDPSYPPERLSWMLDDSQTPLVLTQESLRLRFEERSVRTLCVDHPPAFSGESDANPSGGASPDNLAYVIFTSGSTGRPKGVQIPHRAVVNFLCSMAVSPGMTAEDTLLAVTTLSFDIAGLELYLPLIVGAHVVVASRKEAMDAKLLAQRLAVSGATVMQATPVTWRMLLASGWKGSGSLKVLCGGEAMPPDLASELVGSCGPVWNLYGPTETTIWSSADRLTESEGPITIGRPIANTQIYLLDAHLCAVPTGVPGELTIGGAGVARGYLNRPDVTAERFVPDPFSSLPGAQLYRTGDLARFLPDGKIECLGRIDHQVKIRGFRIELGEIESLLLQHSGIQEAVVLAREDVPGDRRLVGYLVAPDAHALIDLHSFLRVRLPDYMVPGAFIRLDALPLTSNGKVDRRALPAPEGRGAAVSSDLVAPQTPTERWLVEVWQAELRTAPIGIRDSFFEIGGHSLMAVRIFDRIQKEMGRSLSPATLFQAPTIEALAAILDQEDWAPDWKCLVAIRPNGTRPPFFLIHGALAYVLFIRVLVQYLPEEIPIFGVQALGLDGKTRPLTRVEDMAEFYLREIQSVQPSGPYYLGGLSFGGAIALEVAQRMRAQGHEVGLLVMLNTDCPVPSPHFPKRSFLFERKLIPWMFHAEDAAIALHKDGFRQFLGRKVVRAHKSEAGRSVGPDADEEQIEAAAAANDVRMKIFKVNRAAERAYRPRPYPGRITLFYATERHPLQYVETDTRLAWSEFAEGGLEIHLVPGNHVTMRQEPHVKILTAKLTACLDRAHAVKR